MSETKVLHQSPFGWRLEQRVADHVTIAADPPGEWCHAADAVMTPEILRLAADNARLTRELSEANERNAYLESEIIRVEGELAAVLSPNAGR